MSEIKALEKLRSMWERIPVFTHSDELLMTDMDVCMKAIEAEIDANYIRLPCDADGVPWTLETESFIDDTGRKVEFSGLRVDREGRWEIKSNCVLLDPSSCHHVKPDPLKELLHDACMNAMRIRHEQGVGTDIGFEIDETELANYAERIRKLMKESDECGYVWNERTCTFHCSSCGALLTNEISVEWPNRKATPKTLPNYCPNCGKAVKR